MEAAIVVTEGATIEFGVSKHLRGHPEAPHNKHFCILRAGHIWTRIELSELPHIAGNGPVLDNTEAIVSQIVHDVYASDNPMYVNVVGWGPGYAPGTIPADGWESCLSGDICDPFTNLLQEQSLEALAVELLQKSVGSDGNISCGI